MPAQEFMILPTGCKTFSEALRAGAEVYHSLKSIIKKKYGQVSLRIPAQTSAGGTSVAWAGAFIEGGILEDMYIHASVPLSAQDERVY